MTKLEPTDENLASEIRVLEDMQQTPRVAQGLAFLRELQQLRAMVARLEALADKLDGREDRDSWDIALRIRNAIEGKP